MVVTPGTSSAQSGAQVTFGTAVPAGTTIQLADSSGQQQGTFTAGEYTAARGPGGRR